MVYKNNDKIIIPMHSQKNQIQNYRINFNKEIADIASRIRSGRKKENT